MAGPPKMAVASWSRAWRRHHALSLATGDADVGEPKAATIAGPVPLSVFNACTLTWLCTPPPLGPDSHANNDGYGVIAQAFATALGL